MPPGYAPQGGDFGQDGVPPTGRPREPFFEAPPRRPAAAQAAAPAAGGRQSRGYAQDGYGQDETAGGEAQDGYDTDDDADDDYGNETAPKGHKGRIVLATLLAAVVIGGGLGYAYKLSTGATNKSGVLPTVQAEKAPSKAIPVDAGGQKFESGKKILDRANTDSTQAAESKVVPSQEQIALAADGATGQADAIAGPRKVPTVIVKPGEPIQASAANTMAVQDDGVPGISLGEPDTAAATATPATPAMAKSKTRAAAQQVAAADPIQDATATADAAAQQPTKLAGAVAKPAKKAPKTVVATITPADVPADGTDPAVDATADAATAVPDQTTKPKTSTAKSAAGGYIIQVRSTKTQADSLAYFADLQQRYGDILVAAQPDIQEVDLGAKGKWFRLRIGPPGSGAAAKDLCGKLKTGGLKDCIVAAY